MLLLQMQPIPQQMTVQQWLQLALLGAIWGASFFFAKTALQQYGPFTIVLARTLLGSIILLPILWWQRVSLPRDSRFYGWLFVMGLISNVAPMTMLFWAQQQGVPSGLVATLNATTPLWGVLLAHFVMRSERLSLARLGGVLAGLAGVGVMLGVQQGARLPGECAALAAALLYAVSGFYARRFNGLPPLLPAAGQLSASALMLLPLAAGLESPWQAGWPSLASSWSLLALGVVCTAYAFVLYFSLLASAGTTNLLLVTFIIPVSATILSWAFLGEGLGVRQLSGMALVLLGLVILDGRILSQRRRAVPAISASLDG